MSRHLQKFYIFSSIIHNLDENIYTADVHEDIRICLTNEFHTYLYIPVYAYTSLPVKYFFVFEILIYSHYTQHWKRIC